MPHRCLIFLRKSQRSHKERIYPQQLRAQAQALKPVFNRESDLGGFLAGRHIRAHGHDAFSAFRSARHDQREVLVRFRRVTQ
jgi:hypothetical protein